MAYTEVDAAIDKLDRRRAQVSGLRYVLLLLAGALLVGGVGTAALQMRHVDSLNIQMTTIGEVASVTYLYLMALMWGVGGLIGFVFFGWFAAVCHIEAANLEATVILERAKQRME
jgi:hypothetical protein